MRKTKRLLSLLAAFAILLSPVFSPAMTASAEGGTTFYIQYVPALDEWRCAQDSWTEGTQGREFYYLERDIKDGDTIVVTTNATKQCIINIPEVQVGNFTVLGASTVVLHAKGVDEAYILQGGVAAVNGDVKKAFVYDRSTVNFNNNVDYLEVNSTIAENKVHANINVVGTVNHMISYDYNKVVRFDCYSFKPGVFTMFQGNLNVLPENYSLTAPAVTPVAPSKPAAGSDDYDEVPKTGEMPLPYVPVMCVLALCVAGKFALKKTH